MQRPLVLCLLLCAAAPAAAETYKWIDENGVVNYSDAPPPGAAGRKAIPVAERVSTVASDPALAAELAALRAREAQRAQLEETEWLQRQRLLAQREVLAAYAAPCAFPADCDSRYAGMAYPYYPVFFGPAFSAVSLRSSPYLAPTAPAFGRRGFAHAARGHR